MNKAVLNDFDLEDKQIPNLFASYFWELAWEELFSGRVAAALLVAMQKWTWQMFSNIQKIT